MVELWAWTPRGNGPRQISSLPISPHPFPFFSVISCVDILFSHRKVLDHRPPPGIDAPEWFLTICTRPRGFNQLCRSKIAHGIMNLLLDYHRRGLWCLHLAVLMPDHLHAILSLPGARKLESVISSWKRLTAKLLKIRWQRGFFDHRLRSEASAQQKWKYILQNPVRAGLVSQTSVWPYVLRPLARAAVGMGILTRPC